MEKTGDGYLTYKIGSKVTGPTSVSTSNDWKTRSNHGRLSWKTVLSL